MKAKLRPEASKGHFRLFFSFLCCWIFVHQLQAQTIEIGLSVRRTIEPDFYGFNVASTVRNDSYCTNPNLLSKMPLMKPKIYRFPGGAFANWYDWREGWVYDDPNVPTKWDALTKVPNSLLDYKVLRDASGVVSTILDVNMLLSDVTEQIAMLKYANSIGIEVKYVELGNEFYLEGDEDSSFIKQVFPQPSDYGIAASIWIDSIRKHFPNAKIAAQGNFDKNASPRRVIWNDSVLAHLEGEDAMTFHVYYQSAGMDSLETLEEKHNVNMDDVAEWMYQPYKGWDILHDKSMSKVRPGKEVWITEYNMSDHERPTHGYWAHGLYQAMQTLLLMQDSRITHITPHAMCGTAVYGNYYFDTEGFDFGAGEDPNFIPPPVQPPTTFWGLTANGNCMIMIGNGLENKSYASPIVFNNNPQVLFLDGEDSIYYNGLFGIHFNNNNNSDAIIMNLTGNTQSVTTNVMFPSGGTYQMRHAPILRLIATEADVTVVNGSLPQTLVLQPYSITRISANTIPYPPPTVSIVANGPVVFCEGDSVQLDAGAGHYSYVWSTGQTSRKIWAKNDGDYSVKVYDHPGGYYAEASFHITVNKNPKKPSIKVTGSKTFCQGGSTLLYLGPAFTYTNVSYLWPLTGNSTTEAIITTSGNHYLMITDENGCFSVSDTETVIVNPLPVPVIATVGPSQACFDVGVTLNTTQTFNEYSWSGGGILQSKTYKASGTYWLNVTDQNGCSANSNQVSITVWEPPFPTITALGPTTFCADAPTTLTTLSGFTYQWMKGAAILGGATNQNYIPLSSGNYKVIIGDTHGCTKKNDTGKEMTVNSLTAPAITVSNGLLLCQGETTQLSMPAGYNSYKWSTGSTASMITVGSAGTYTCTIEDANGCKSTTPPKVLIVNPLPQPIITPLGATSFCDGQSVTLTAQAGFNQYTWSNGKSGQSVTAETAGAITVTVKDINNCYGTSSPVNLSVWTVPEPTVSCSGPSTYCLENPSTLSTVAGYAYQWKKGSTVLTGATNQIYSPTVTNANYKVTITDNHGCSKTSGNFSVTVNAAAIPSLTVTGGSTICQGKSSTIAATAGYSSYHWSSGQTTSSISVSTAGNYFVTVTDANGCTATSAPKTIVVNAVPQPVITATGPTSFCDGGSVTLDAGSGYTEYNWSNGKITQTVSITASGTYSVTVTNANGCAGTSAAVNVTEWIPITPTVTTSTGATTFCANSGVYLTTLAGSAYQWQKSSTNIAGATTQNYIPSSGGSYKVIVTDVNGCSKTSSALSITINSNPAPVISGPGTVCQGSSVILSCGTFSAYTWSTGSHAATISVNGAGNYSVTVTDANGCAGTSPVKTTTLSPLPAPVIVAQGPVQFCDGGSVTLDAGSGYSSYNWSNAKTTQTNAITASGTFTVSVTNANGCAGTSAPVTVTEWIPPTPTVSAVGPTTYCINSGTYLTTLSGPYGYQWLKGSAVQNGATNQTFTPVSSGTYKVKITDVNGCNKTSVGLKVTVNSAPTASISISGSANICSGQTKVISANTGTGLIYTWKLNGNIIAGAIASSYTAGIAGTYTCIVTNANGCSTTSNSIIITSNCKGDEFISKEDEVSWLIYPNPTSSELHIRFSIGDQESGSYIVEIRNLLGTVIWQNESTFTDHNIREDVYLEASVSSGVYFVIVHVNGQTYHSRFVISK